MSGAYIGCWYCESCGSTLLEERSSCHESMRVQCIQEREGSDAPAKVVDKALGTLVGLGGLTALQRGGLQDFGGHSHVAQAGQQLAHYLVLHGQTDCSAAMRRVPICHHTAQVAKLYAAQEELSGAEGLTRQCCRSWTSHVSLKTGYGLPTDELDVVIPG